MTLSRVIECDSSRVILWKTWLESSWVTIFSTWLKSSPSHQKSLLESSHWLMSRYHCTVLLVKRLQWKLLCASNITSWELDPGGLSPTLCDSKCQNTIIKLWKLKLMMFLYSYQHEINLWSSMLLFFLLPHSCYFVIWETKMHEETMLRKCLQPCGSASNAVAKRFVCYQPALCRQCVFVLWTSCLMTSWIPSFTWTMRLRHNDK